MPEIQRGLRRTGALPGRCWGLSTTKRATLPGADELFRTTSLPKPQPTETVQAPSEEEETPNRSALQPSQAPQRTDLSTSAHSPAPRINKPTPRFVDKSSKLQVPKEGSGRQRHEEKITFYCTREELLAIERARLA